MIIILRTMREKRGWSQAELSRRSGVPQPIISDIEAGKIKGPTVTTMKRLADALRCMIDDLIAREEAS